MSTFEALSKLISVSDICEPFLAEFDSSLSIESVFDQWSIDLCIEKELDPMEQIALVKQNQKIMGWIGFDMLDSSKSLKKCIEPIDSDILISSDTPLLEAIRTVCNSDKNIYLVLKGNKFIGFLSYSHFHKLPFRMCLFSLLIDLERMMIEITKTNPVTFLANLTENRLNYAKKIYKYRGYPFNNENEEYHSKLIDCTTFVDKFTMLRKNQIIIKKCPNIESKFSKTAEKVRNSIAHPDGEKSGLIPMSKEELLPFIQWAEELQIQLYSFNQS